MDSLFWGSSEKAFFNFDYIDRVRRISKALYPKPYYALLNDPKYKYEPKRNGEVRLLSMDIATQGGTKNDATCFVVMQLIPTLSNQYIRNVVYLTTLDGGHTFDQALEARRLFDDFDCDYIIVDTNGVGVGELLKIKRPRKSAELSWEAEMLIRVRRLCLKAQSGTTHSR